MGLGSGIRDLGSRIRKKPILDPGSMRPKGTRTGIRNSAAMQILFALGDRIRGKGQTEILQHTLL
jgi:hypothetical protein